MDYIPPEYAKVPPDSVRRKCRLIVIRWAAYHDVPPGHVTAHLRSISAVRARRDAMREMLRDLGLNRGQVAMAFQRDLRRVRKSVLGQ